jgi:signal transduction histidine kinase
MKLPLLTKQKRIGVILSLFAFFVFTVQSIQSFLAPENIISLITGILMVGSIIYENRFFKSIQGGLLLAIGLFYTYTYTDNLFGYWIYFIGSTVLYKYGLLNNRIKLKAFLYTLIYSVVLILTVLIGKEPVSLLVRYAAFSLVSGILIFILFEEEIINLLKLNKKTEEELIGLQPIVLLGEKTSAIVHSFKNLFSQLNTATYFIKEDIDKEKGIATLEKVIGMLHKRMDALLSISKAGYTLEKKVIDISQTLHNINYILLEDNEFKRNAKIELEILPDVYVETIELEFILMMENILKNAIDALLEIKKYGLITIYLDHEKLEITNNGGAITTCKNCNTISCLHCKKYEKIGYTTREGGSGNGMFQILRTVKHNNWDILIRGFDNKTQITIYIKKRETT